MISKLKEIRKKFGYSQHDIGKKLGYNQTLVSKWEKGTCDPGTDALLKLSDLFNISIDELLCNERFLTNQMPRNAIVVPDEKKETVQMLLDLPDFAFNLAKSYIEGVSATSRVL